MVDRDEDAKRPRWWFGGAPCDRDEGEGKGVETRLVFGVSRGPVHLDRKLYSWQTRLACELLVFRVFSVLFPAFFFFFFVVPWFPFPLLVLSEDLDPGERIGVVLAADPPLRFRYPLAFSLSFSPPDVFPYALLAWPWKEKFGIKWVPSTARGIIIHADERNAGPH